MGSAHPRRQQARYILAYEHFWLHVVNKIKRDLQLLTVGGALRTLPSQSRKACNDERTSVPQPRAKQRRSGTNRAEVQQLKVLQWRSNYSTAMAQ